MIYNIVTSKQNDEIVRAGRNKLSAQWPEFMLHDPISNLLADCYERLPEYQFVLLKGDDSEPVALGNSIPLRWDDGVENLTDNGWDWAIQTGIDDIKHNRRPNILCALQAVVFGDNQGKGISALVLKAMKQIGREYGFKRLIAPVRPSKKSDFPEMPMKEYIKLKLMNDEGYPIDPWIRVHYKEGGRIIKPCHKSMTITGSIAEWEDWTGMSFSESGKHIVPFALVPVDIDIENDTGTYIEPNVWVVHEL